MGLKFELEHFEALKKKGSGDTLKEWKSKLGWVRGLELGLEHLMKDIKTEGLRDFKRLEMHGVKIRIRYRNKVRIRT